MPSQPEYAAGSKIIELTDVVEEGHPDQPNLPRAASSSMDNEVLDDLDLEKEIDQIFADLGAPSTESEPAEAQDKSVQEELDLDDLFGKAQTVSLHESGQTAEEPANVSAITLDGAAPGEEHEDALQGIVEDNAVHGDETPAEAELEESLHQDQIADLGMPEVKADDFGLGLDEPTTAQAVPSAPLTADELAALRERLSALEEKIGSMDNLDQLVAGHVSQRLEAYGQEATAEWEERISSLRQELETAWEQKSAELIQAGLAEARAGEQESLAQTLTALKEEITALLDSRLQELRPAADPEEQSRLRQQMQEEILSRTQEIMLPPMEQLRSEWDSERENRERAAETQAGVQEAIQALQKQWQSFQEQAEAKLKENAEDLSATLEQLRADLLQELQAAVPSAAARIIREEIQALSEE